MNVMRVILIDVNYGQSSTGKIVFDLAKQLNMANHTAKVLYGRGKKSTDEVGVRVASPFEVYFHALMTRLTGLTGFFSFFATRKIIRFINDFQPDVIHLHELHGYYVNSGRLIEYLKLKNIPVVWTFHCEFAYTGKCGYAYDCQKWKTNCEKCPQLKEYPASMYFDFTNQMHRWKKNDFQGFNNISIVTPSKWLANRVKLSFLHDKPISVIHNGIDTASVFYPRRSAHLVEKHGLKNKKIILAVAPNIMDERKGGQWILNLAGQFDDNHRFIMIGLDGDLENPPSNVITVKRTENQIELAEYYSLADLFVICSKRENFPTTCLESLACGTPVLGFKEGGTAETAPFPYGYFVSYGDLTAIKLYIDGFYSGGIKFKSPDECRAYAVDNYSKEVMCANYLKLFTDMNKGVC